MNARHLFHTIILIFLAASPLETDAQPERPVGDNEFGGTPGMHLFLPSSFLTSIREDRLLFARTRNFNASYCQAISEQRHEQALAYADSLISASEHHPLPGVQFIGIYETRARLLDTLGQTRDACVAYQRAIEVQDSLMRLEQTEIIREMQVSYELDRLALDQALLRARHHKTTLISILLLFAASAAGIVFIHRTNRRIKRLQSKLLLQIRHARESEEKKIAFINSMCHEVRTPLNSVSGFSELLCESGINAEAYGQYCEIIRDNCRQLRYLFDDMLEVAYLETLNQPLPYRYTDLCTLCRTQLRVMKVRHPKPNVLYEDGIPSEQIALMTNEKYLALLLSALLSNAYKFTEQGSVRLECDREGDDCVRISVSDTGCGIPPEKQESVFDRFTKLDPFSQGNGLGLYLCRLIAYHLGGEIHIDPSYTNGTRIVVTLPRRPKDAAADHK